VGNQLRFFLAAGAGDGAVAGFAAGLEGGAFFGGAFFGGAFFGGASDVLSACSVFASATPGSAFASATAVVVAGAAAGASAGGAVPRPISARVVA